MLWTGERLVGKSTFGLARTVRDVEAHLKAYKG